MKLDQVEAEGGGDVGRLWGDFRSNTDITGCQCGWRRRQWLAGNDGVLQPRQVTGLAQAMPHTHKPHRDPGSHGKT